MNAAGACVVAAANEGTCTTRGVEVWPRAAQRGGAGGGHTWWRRFLFSPSQKLTTPSPPAGGGRSERAVCGREAGVQTRPGDGAKPTGQGSRAGRHPLSAGHSAACCMGSLSTAHPSTAQKRTSRGKGAEPAIEGDCIHREDQILAGLVTPMALEGILSGLAVGGGEANRWLNACRLRFRVCSCSPAAAGAARVAAQRMRLHRPHERGMSPAEGVPQQGPLAAKQPTETKGPPLAHAASTSQAPGTPWPSKGTGKGTRASPQGSQPGLALAARPTPPSHCPGPPGPGRPPGLPPRCRRTPWPPAPPPTPARSPRRRQSSARSASGT